MPILPDVEGILLELLFFLPHSVNDSNLDGTEQLTTLSVRTGRINSHIYNSNNIPKSLSSRPNGQHGNSAISDPCADSDTSPEQWSNENNIDFLEPVQRHESLTVHVAAVALLLSQVGQTWRTMESPLFDSAGTVVGRVKTAARVTGRRAIRSGLNETTSLGGSGRLYPEPHLKTDKTNEQAPTKGHMSEAEYRGRTKSRRCCGGASRCSRSTELSRLPDLPDLRRLPAIEEDIQPPLERSVKRIPQSVTLIYRGLRIPLRWYCTGSTKIIDKSLRETLGGYLYIRYVLCCRDTNRSSQAR